MVNARLIEGVRPGRMVCFEYEGRLCAGFEGEGVALALLRAGVAGGREQDDAVAAQGYYCGMGVCWECVLEVEGEGTVRGCQYPVREGLVVRAVRVLCQEAMP